MEAFTIDATARFVSTLSFELGSGDVSALSSEVRRAVEERVPKQKGFIGCVVMASAEKSRLMVVSLWESAHAWSAAQYDLEIGRAVADAVETAASYDVQTYETITVVR
jgi:heme-degrading monooxygenase HmoA